MKSLLCTSLVALVTVRATHYAPNAFLGTCLTEEWVQDMEAMLGVNASDRNQVTGQLLNPFLRAALPGARYSVSFFSECIASFVSIFS